MVEKQEAKRRLYDDIEKSLDKISELFTNKLKDEIISKIISYKKNHFKKFEPNYEIQFEYAKVKKIINEKPLKIEEECNKVKSIIDEYERNLIRNSSMNLMILKSMLGWFWLRKAFEESVNDSKKIFFHQFYIYSFLYLFLSNKNIF